MMESIPSHWLEALEVQHRPVDFVAVGRLVDRVTDEGLPVYPPVGNRYEALRRTPFACVRAVILGQDPYHRFGQAHGLAFSTLADKRPGSLRNILREWHDDCGFEIPDGNSLGVWARHGVLLLNTALTVRERAANSHGPQWQTFTDALIDTVAAKPQRVAFLLWGAAAIEKGRSIDGKRHIVIESSHPSPLSANRTCGDAPAFLGSRPFSRANLGLVDPIDWSLE
jgi:uracil-DNA glycosylase